MSCLRSLLCRVEKVVRSTLTFSRPKPALTLVRIHACTFSYSNSRNNSSNSSSLPSTNSKSGTEIIASPPRTIEAPTFLARPPKIFTPAKTEVGTESNSVYYSTRNMEKAKVDSKIIWVDCEMTGLDTYKDMLMEVGCYVTNSDLEIIARQPSIVIQIPDDVLSNMGAWCVEHHGASGLTEACRNSKITLKDADEMLHKFVQEHTTPGLCPMAGNSIYMDRIFISRQLPTFHNHFHYRNVDVSTVKELVSRWYIKEYLKAPRKRFDHRVEHDIEDSIAELKYYRTAVFRQMPEEKSANEKSGLASNKLY